MPSYRLTHEKNYFGYLVREGEESSQGRWAKGRSMDGKGEFEYVANPQPQGPAAEPPQPNPLLHGTGKTSQANATDKPNVIERIVGES